MERLKIPIILLALVLILIGGNSIAGKVDMLADQSIDFDSIKTRSVFFGHQSVGMNVIEGIETLLLAENIETYKIYNLDKTSEISAEKGFYHNFIGENGNSESKLAHFREIIAKNHKHINIAFLKFCYVEITADTNVDALFTSYKSTMDSLVAAYPQITFVHVTVPLRIVQSGPKAWVKQLLNKPLGGAADNAQRNRYNQLLLNHYKSAGELIFDLAAAESTFADGHVFEYSFSGQQYRSLIPEYTQDGRHLNNLGKKVVATRLLVFLSQL